MSDHGPSLRPNDLLGRPWKARTLARRHRRMEAGHQRNERLATRRTTLLTKTTRKINSIHHVQGLDPAACPVGLLLSACRGEEHSAAVVIDARRRPRWVPMESVARHDRPAPTLTGYDELLR